MQKNIGLIDRWTRIAIGLLLLVLSAAGVIGPWGYLGLIPLVTGVVARCPLYTILGVQTCRREAN